MMSNQLLNYHHVDESTLHSIKKLNQAPLQQATRLKCSLHFDSIKVTYYSILMLKIHFENSTFALDLSLSLHHLFVKCG